MRTRRTVRLSLALLATLAPALGAQQPDYAKAERMLTWNTAPLVANDILSVTWLADSTRFWYRVSRPAGYEFVLVDPVTNTTRPVFDHLKLASALTRMEAGRAFVRGDDAPLLHLHAPRRRPHAPLQERRALHRVRPHALRVRAEQRTRRVRRGGAVA